MEADADRDAHAVVRDEMGLMQGAQGVEQRQAGMHGAVRGVFVGLGPAKVDQQAIAEILGDIALVGLESGSGHGLVGTHHRAIVFRVELLGQCGRGDQVTEHHRDLPAFGVGGGVERDSGNGGPTVQGLDLRGAEGAVKRQRGRDGDDVGRSRRAEGGRSNGNSGVPRLSRPGPHYPRRAPSV